MADERGTIHLTAALTNISIGYKNAEYIADSVLPIVPVNKDKDSYYVFGREAFRLENDRRAAKAPSNRINSWTSTTATYTCETHSLHDIVDRRERANADAPLRPDVTTTERIQDKLLLRKEYDVAATLFNATTFSGYTAALTGNDRWDDYVNSDPLAKVDDIKVLVQKQIGRKPNTMIIGKEVFDKVKRHPDLLDLFKHTQRGILTKELLAEAFGIEKIIVGEAVYNSAAEGATEVMTYLWGKFVLLCYVTPRPALDEPSVGYMPHWKIYGGKIGMTKKWYDNDLDGDKIENTISYDVLVCAARAGYLLSTVVS